MTDRQIAPPTPKYRKDGIRTLKDLKGRCRIDPDTGCWMWTGSVRKGAVIWIPGVGACGMPAALEILHFGKRAPKGRMYVPTCCRPLCANPAHRKLGTRSEYMQALRPVLEPVHRAAITRTTRAKFAKVTPEQVQDILTSDDNGEQAAAKHGLSQSQVSRIRLRQCWVPNVANSVFSWRPA